VSRTRLRLPASRPPACSPSVSLRYGGIDGAAPVRAHCGQAPNRVYRISLGELVPASAHRIGSEGPAPVTVQVLGDRAGRGGVDLKGRADLAFCSCRPRPGSRSHWRSRRYRGDGVRRHRGVEGAGRHPDAWRADGQPRVHSVSSQASPLMPLVSYQPAPWSRSLRSRRCRREGDPTQSASFGAPRPQRALNAGVNLSRRYASVPIASSRVATMPRGSYEGVVRDPV
jgi:hypothetical protein